MRTGISYIKYFFLLTGIGFLVGAFFTYQNTQEFIKASTSTQGTVVDLISHASTDSDGNRSYIYHPLVEFEAKKGEKIAFESNVGSYPASYQVGEEVDVLYLPENPQQARIRSFGSLWLVPVILGSFGIVSVSFSVIFILAGSMNKNKMI